MVRKTPLPSISSRVAIVHDGKEYSSGYSVSRGKIPLLTVSGAHGTKSTQLGGMPPDALARLLLIALVSRSG